MEGVNNSCRLLDLQRYHRVIFRRSFNEQPSSILLLYTILVLSQIRSEETLITYLKKWTSLLASQNRLHQFKDITLNFDLSVRMQSVLQRLSTEGGPLFPTEDVRKAANETLDVLYPVGPLELSETNRADGGRGCLFTSYLAFCIRITGICS